MSLITHRNLKAAKPIAATGRAERVAVAFAITAFVGAARKVIMQGARLFSHAAQTVSEARQHRAAIEAELYLNRYKHSSKNDDDLPIVR
jgi:hypothetical protein